MILNDKTKELIASVQDAINRTVFLVPRNKRNGDIVLWFGLDPETGRTDVYDINIYRRTEAFCEDADKYPEEGYKFPENLYESCSFKYRKIQWDFLNKQEVVCYLLDEKNDALEKAHRFMDWVDEAIQAVNSIK